jgi:hypothetical protein
MNDWSQRCAIMLSMRHPKSNPLNINAYPLHWPAGWKVTPGAQRSKSLYRVSFASARDAVFAALKKMGATDIVMSTNVPLRHDGLPYANWKEPDAPGVAVYWTRRGSAAVMACDSWRTVRENMRAISVSLEAMLTMERARAGEILERAYQGFAALPETSVVEEDWRVALRLSDTPDAEMTPRVVRDAWIARMKMVHPDCGGTEQQAVQVNKAYATATEWLKARGL